MRRPRRGRDDCLRLYDFHPLGEGWTNDESEKYRRKRSIQFYPFVLWFFEIESTSINLDSKGSIFVDIWNVEYNHYVWWLIRGKWIFQRINIVRNCPHGWHCQVSNNVSFLERLFATFRRHCGRFRRKTAAETIFNISCRNNFEDTIHAPTNINKNKTYRTSLPPSPSSIVKRPP